MEILGIPRLLLRLVTRPEGKSGERLLVFIRSFPPEEVGLFPLMSSPEFEWMSVPGVTAVVGIAAAVGLILFLFINYKVIYIILKTLPRDVKGAYRFINVVRGCRWAERRKYIVAHLFDAIVERTPEKACFLFEDQRWTYKEVQELSNRIGNFFAAEGLKKGDTIAILMESRPEFPCFWLGLSRVGIVPALVNHNLRLQPLLHSIKIVNAKAIIYGHELSSAIEDLMKDGELQDIPLFSTGHKNEVIRISKARDLEKEIESAPCTTPKEMAGMITSDSLFYIYTSGTTGMPKAAIIKNFRYMMATNGIHFMNGVNDKDVIYTPLPLYHMTGVMVGVGMAFTIGATVVIRKRFSASNFWKDCITYDVTVAQYLGETSRYLLAQKPSIEDRAHKIRMMVGNGLRHELWEEFTTRFGIREIGEVYGSTEGNCNIANIDSHVGAVGFVPRLLYPLLPMALIRINPETGEPLRNPKTGLAIKCKPNQPGELFGKIIKNHPIRDFHGYTDNESTQKKIVKDVFHKGDMAFRTGDVLKMDDFGYFYFKDRTGDTFRWKGENVSTTEVESIISNVCGFKDAVVYGVEVPGTEGKAGMAAIADPEQTIDIDLLADGIVKSLPSYGRPLFLRILNSIDLTSTYKMKKQGLQKEGFNVNSLKDKIYFLQDKNYIPLDIGLYGRILNGGVRL